MIDSLFLLSHQRCRGQCYRSWHLSSHLLFLEVRENRRLKSRWNGKKQVPKLAVFFKSNTVAPVNSGFLLNTKADYQSVSPSLITDSDWFIFWFAPPTNPMEKHAEPFRSEQLLLQALNPTGSIIFMSGFKREKSTGPSSKECSTATKSTLHFFSHFKTIKIAYLFLPVWTSSQVFGLLYSFPHYSEDTRLLFQYFLSDPAFRIHCTYASTHFAQGP